MTDERAAESRPAPDGARGDGAPPRYASFGDYVRVVRRHKWIVLLVTVVLVAASLAVSLSKETTYEAQAQLSVRDLVADLNLLGSDATPDQPPAQLAEVSAQTIDRPQVTRLVAKRIGRLSPAALADAVTARVGTQTNLVIVEARAGTAELAARIANEYAQAAKRVGDAAQRRRLERAERATEKQVDRARADERDEPGTVTVRLSVLEQTLSRIQTLRQIAEPVQIVSAARPPDSPVSPTPVRDAFLGGMVGLVLGLLAAFGRDSLDRRLHSAKDLHDELGVPVLSRVPNSALGSAGLVGNGKPPMPEAEFEAFRVLRMNLAALAADRPLRSVLVTSGLPEEGKSTVSIALACAATAAGQRTLLVECDLRRPSFAGRLSVEREPGLTDYLRGDASPQDVLRTIELELPNSMNGNAPSSAARSAGTLVCIPAGSPAPNPAELLISPRFEDFLGKVTRTYDLVVIDAGPMLSIVDPLQLVPQVDGVLLCVRAQRTTRDQVRAARAALANLPDRPVGAVLTGLKRNADPYDYYYAE